MARFRELFEPAKSKDVFMPEFIHRQEGHFLDLSVGGDYLDYRTFWQPNLPVMIEVADQLGLDFLQKYQEAGMAVWGEATYKDGEFQNIRLVHNDHSLYTYDAACEQFDYQGKTYEDQYEIWNLLLDAKKAAAAAPAFRQRMAGVLPHIDLAGTDFTIDWRLRELRESAEPWNRIDLRNLEMTPDGESYLCGYNPENHEQVDIAEAETILELPGELTLDLVAVARENQLFETDLLLVYPLQEQLAAKVHTREQLIAAHRQQARSR